uniref:Uncharacterized protein n=1 Tax=Trichogramma kaykai TaxID=54128 RepID=A0ABD2WZ66_9HYME
MPPSVEREQLGKEKGPAAVAAVHVTASPYTLCVLQAREREIGFGAALESLSDCTCVYTCNASAILIYLHAGLHSRESLDAIVLYI